MQMQTPTQTQSQAQASAQNQTQIRAQARRQMQLQMQMWTRHMHPEVWQQVCHLMSPHLCTVRSSRDRNHQAPGQQKRRCSQRLQHLSRLVNALTPSCLRPALRRLRKMQTAHQVLRKVIRLSWMMRWPSSSRLQSLS